eukprot:3244383-Rhodomonas_salina.1
MRGTESGIVLRPAYGMGGTEWGMVLCVAYAIFGASKRAKLAQAVRESEMKYNKVQIRRLKYAFWSGREGVVGGEEVGKEKKKEGDRIDVYVVCTVLCPSYALSSTDMAYAPTQCPVCSDALPERMLLRALWHAPRPCLVLTRRMLLQDKKTLDEKEYYQERRTDPPLSHKHTRTP